jgi:hypothetical protein
VSRAEFGATRAKLSSTRSNHSTRHRRDAARLPCAAPPNPQHNAKGKRMTRGETEQQGVDLDRYGDGDEATIRRDSSSETELQHYEEEEVATLPWPARMV